MATTATAKPRRAPAKKVADAPANTLSHLVPDQSFYDDYVSRMIKGVQDIDILRYAMSTQKNTLLFGPTGPGKTSLILAYGAADKLPVVTIACNGAIEPGAAFGSPIMDEAGRIHFQEADAIHVVRQGGILYFDEINFMPPKIAAVFHGLLDKRRQVVLIDKQGELIKASPNLQIIAAFNPDYEGTRPLNPAFKNRFPLKVSFPYDREVEAQLVYCESLLDAADQLRQRHDAGDLETPVSTNMLIEFEELCLSFSDLLGGDGAYAFALENFLNAFGTDERSSVRDAMELHSANIQDEINKMIEEANAAE